MRATNQNISELYVMIQGNNLNVYLLYMYNMTTGCDNTLLESLLFDSTHNNKYVCEKNYTNKNNRTNEMITKNQKEYGHRKRIKP